jgi:outer membrane protein TolC
MKRELPWFVGLVAIPLLAFPGCMLAKRDVTFEKDLGHYETVATEIEYPNVAAPSDDCLVYGPEPRSLGDPEPDYWDMTLQEAIELALANSEVMRNIGGALLNAPDRVPTPYEPAIQETDPRYGVEAALSAFDAQFSSSWFFEKNDRRLNNKFLGDLGFFEQDLDTFNTQLTKRAATGSQFTLRKFVEFDNNNQLGNEFLNGSWTVWLDAEARHPLLRHGGVNFNRIAGPAGTGEGVTRGTPGSINGVLVARVSTDISLADFEAGLRNLVTDVEKAYWNLYHAYRHLQAKRKARDKALEIWRTVHAWQQTGRRGGEAENEAQARALYYELQQDVQDALAGKPESSIPGVLFGERHLRRLIALPANGERLIRPSDEPELSPLRFDWYEIAGESLVRRVELRRQRWQVKRRELELIASRNFLLPNLDLVGRYRWRGFGEELLDSSREGKPRFDNAFMDLTSGKFQEWQLGAEFSVPIGFRQGHAAVRNAELRLTRERAVLREQERDVINLLSSAVAEKNRAYIVLQTKHNHLLAARQRSQAAETTLDTQAEPITPDLIFRLMDAYRREADAESAYFRLQIEYVKAILAIHFQKGSLLDYNGVVLAEGPWPRKAYFDADERERLRGRPLRMSYALNRPPVVSQGVYPQITTSQAPPPVRR